MLKDQKTFDFMYSKYKDSIKEMMNLYTDFLGFTYPQNDKRFDLMSKLIGTQLSEGIYILNYLHKSIDLDGDVCEFGIAQGATSAFLADEIKNTDKKIWLFDSFQGLPKPTEKDTLKDDIFNLGSMDAYTGTMSCGLEQVTERLNDIQFPFERVNIVPGFIEETIKFNNLPDKVSFAYVDFDFYEPILIALNFLDNVLVENGHIVVDDYDFFSTGAKTAVDEFIESKKDRYEFIKPVDSAGKFCVLRKKPIIMRDIKVTFCMITCDGDDYIYENVKNIYPFAHSICISEGATENWGKAMNLNSQRSSDKTLELLNKLKSEDTENKIRIIHKKDFYRDKLEQTNYYMMLVPEDTDYIWVVDDDEFYLPEDITKMIDILKKNDYSMVTVKMYHFWKNYDTIGDGEIFNDSINRIWKYKVGDFFIDHRPMKISEEDSKNILNNKDVICRHYSFINEKRVYDKMLYYSKTFGLDYIENWYKPVWKEWNEKNKDYVEENHTIHPSYEGGKTRKFDGKHPKILERKIKEKKND